MELRAGMVPVRLFSWSDAYGKGVVSHILLGSRMSDHAKNYIQAGLGGHSLTLYTTAITGYEVSRNALKHPKSRRRA